MFHGTKGLKTIRKIIFSSLLVVFIHSFIHNVGGCSLGDVTSGYKYTCGVLLRSVTRRRDRSPVKEVARALAAGLRRS